MEQLMKKNRFGITVKVFMLFVLWLNSLAAQETDSSSPRGEEAVIGKSEEESVLSEELRVVLGKLREERAAYYERQRNRAGQIEEAHSNSQKLEKQLTELREREEDIDRELAKLKNDVEQLRQEEQANVSAQLQLTDKIDKWIFNAAKMVEQGIPYRKEERLKRLTGSVENENSRQTPYLSDKLGGCWSFFQEEMRIAGSGESFTGQVSVGDDRLRHARLCRVGHQILGYLTEDGSETGIWLPGQDGLCWRHSSSGPEAEAIRAAVEILDHRERPRLISVPVEITSGRTTEQKEVDKK